MPLDIVHPGWPQIDNGVFFMFEQSKWQVDAQKSPGVWTCSRPTGHGYDRVTREFTEAEVNANRVHQPRTVRTYEWLKDLNVGDILHYTPYRAYPRGKQPFVRCRLEFEDGVAYISPLALVGDWQENDLPHYDYSGKFQKGHDIIDTIVWQRRQTLNHLEGFYEAEAIGDAAYGHPKDWETLSLEPRDRRDRELTRLKAIGAKIDEVLPRRMVRSDYPMPWPFPFPFPFDREDRREERDIGLGATNYKDELRNTLRKMRDILNAADLEEPVKEPEKEPANG